MAKQVINIGATPNDGTGDPIRLGATKVNDNFTELYNVQGWGYYRDGETAIPSQIFDSSPKKLLIDSLNPLTNTSYLPTDIRGFSDLWDNNTNTIKPISLGDSYVVRLEIGILSTTSNPTRFEIILDIGTTQDGTGLGNSTLIVQDSRTLKTGVPQNHTISFPIFSLNTFLANNGSIWIKVSSGTIEVVKRSILITRISKGGI